MPARRLYMCHYCHRAVELDYYKPTDEYLCEECMRIRSSELLLESLKAEHEDNVAHRVQS
jgi:hypothetical protein